jgi:exodeoxyribonuclease V alpha subunit
LTEVFRQAQHSSIIEYAHQINRGEVPRIESPFRYPDIWRNGTDCFFLDSEEATREQLSFIGAVKRLAREQTTLKYRENQELAFHPYEFRTAEALT